MHSADEISPVRWSELLEQKVGRTIAHVEELSRELNKLRPGHRMTLSSLAGAGNAITDALPRLGPAGVRPLIEAAHAVWTRENTEPGASESTTVVLGIANLRVALSASNRLTHDPSRENVYLDQLYATRKKMNEQDEFRFAFHALGAGRPDLVTALLGEEKDKVFNPNATFEFHTEAFLRHIARAQSSSRSRADVEAAWREFVQLFPRKYAARTLKLRDFVQAGRAVLVQLAGLPLVEFPEAVYALVRAS